MFIHFTDNGVVDLSRVVFIRKHEDEDVKHKYKITISFSKDHNTTGGFVYLSERDDLYEKIAKFIKAKVL